MEGGDVKVFDSGIVSGKILYVGRGSTTGVKKPGMKGVTKFESSCEQAP